MAEKRTFLFNETFKGVDEESHLNACVGNNGYVDQRSYGDGFADAVKILTKAIVDGKDKNAYLDTLIYPICFCARHHIELFLKKQIIIIQDIRKVPNDSTIFSAHDISNLWDRMELIASQTDRRFIEPLAKMKPYVEDFGQIDPTGQTFRYPFSTEAEKHLVKTPVINIPNFRKRYLELLELTSTFESMADYISSEYEQGTYTTQLSREEIRLIAHKISPHSEWGTEPFNVLKEELRKPLGISSKSFDNALRLIRNHREFAPLVGLEIPLVELTAGSLDNFQAIAEKKLPVSDLSKTEWAALTTINNMAGSHHYSEEYDFLLKHFEEDFDIDYYRSSEFKKLARSGDNIKNGLRKLGQISLLKHFEEHIDLSEANKAYEEENAKLTALFKANGLKTFE